MTRRNWAFTTIVALSLAGFVAAVGVRASGPAPQRAQSVPSTSARLTEMRHHFGQVVLIHEAVIRGDLPAVKAPAIEVAAVVMPAGMPATATPFVLAIRRAGQRAADATTLAAAAEATVAMVTECANCHRAVGVFPAPSRPATHDVGAIVGHMLEHQRAADDMLVGLMIPSPSQWRTGAERLRAAPLRPAELPRDSKLTDYVREADVEVHRIADQASAAETPDQRAAAYLELLTSCAKCHSLHSKVWGPGRGGSPDEMK